VPACSGASSAIQTFAQTFDPQREGQAVRLPSSLLPTLGGKLKDGNAPKDF
jgi:hypothetical protein